MKVYLNEENRILSPERQATDRSASLRRLPFFSSFDTDEQISLLVEAGDWYKFPATSFVIREGELEHRLYVVISGRLRVFKSGKTLAVLHPGEIVGEMGAMLYEERCANVISLEDSTLFGIDVGALKKLPREILFLMMQHVYRVTAGRLRDVDRRLAAV